MCSRAGNPSAAKKPSFRRTLVGPSPEKGPGSRLLLQVDTTQNRRKAIISQTLRGSSFGKLRTVVWRNTIWPRCFVRRKYGAARVAPSRRPFCPILAAGFAAERHLAAVAKLHP